MLAAESIGFGDGEISAKRIVPTTRPSYYAKGMRVSDDDSYNFENAWGETWYIDPDDHRVLGILCDSRTCCRSASKYRFITNFSPGYWNIGFVVQLNVLGRLGEQIERSIRWRIFERRQQKLLSALGRFIEVCSRVWDEANNIIPTFC